MLRNRPQAVLAIVLVVLALSSAACSPEASRQRGGGPGADVGNRVLGPSVELHGNVDPNFDVPSPGKANQVIGQ